MKEFIFSCVNPELSILGLKNINEFINFIDESENISKKEFLDNCKVDEMLDNDIKRFPNDYNFFKKGEVIFFTHSCIEYFYI